MDHNIKTLHNLKLLNWNANGIKAQRSIFIAFLARHNIDIACISETHLTTSDNIKISGYRIYRTDRQARIASGGVAILIKRNIIHHELPKINTTNIETVAIKVRLNDGSFVNIISAYKQPNKPLIEEDIKVIFNTREPTLLIGDLNCKNTIWGCRTNNPAGVKLNELATTYTCQILAPEEYTYYPYRMDHNPDILDIIVQKNFTKQIFQQVHTELDSDHVPVLISFIITPEKAPLEPRLINGVVDWKRFQEVIDDELRYPNELKSPDDIDETIVNFTTCITKSIQIATKVQNSRKRADFNLPPAHILELIKQKSRLRREWQQTRNPVTKNMLNNLSHRVKRELDAYRIQRYEKYISDFERGDPGLWKTTRKILHQPQEIPPITTESTTFNTDEEKCEGFADYLEKTFTPPEHHNPQFKNMVVRHIETHMPTPGDIMKPTSPKEVASIIKTLPVKKSPGHDMIPNVILKHLTPKALAHLASLFNACLSKGYFPKTWKHALILMFPKPGKNKRTLANYRPISLLTTLSKLFEKIIYFRLNDELATLEILPTTQFGFRKGHSTCHQLQRIVELIERGYENKQFSTALFLDIAQAFDRVWIEGLKYKITNLQIPNYIKIILFSFLENRTFAVKIHATVSSTRNIRAGVPQGSILGPILFNIYMYDVPNTKADLAMFADDTVLITKDEHLSQAITQLQAATNILCKWLQKWNLTINYTKCITKTFSLRRISYSRNIVMNGNSIEWNSNDEPVKYLGVYLDTKLTWKYHILKKLNEGHTRLTQLYPIINKKSALKASCTTLLYKSLIRPLLMYGCTVWGNASKTNLNKIQILQNKVLRIAVDAPWFITNEQLHRELGILTVREHIKKLTQNFHLNLNSCPSAQYYELGQRRIHTRLKRKLAQDTYLVESDSE